MRQSIHLGLYDIFEVSSKSYYTVLIAGIITFMVRVYSYFDAGMYYGATAVISLFGFYLVKILINRIREGKKVVYYRLDYNNGRTLFPIYYNTYLLALGTFAGNTIYYLNRYKVWNDPSQILRMFTELMHPMGILIGLIISFLIYRYLFLEDKFIESKEYARRVYLKMTNNKMSEREAYLTVLREQKKFQLYGILPEDASNVQVEKKANAFKKKKVEVTIDEDIYAEARMKRGSKE